MKLLFALIYAAVTIYVIGIILAFVKISSPDSAAFLSNLALKPPGSVGPGGAAAPSGSPTAPLQGPSTSPASPGAAAAPLPAPVPPTNHEKIYAAARAAGVNILSYAENGKTVTIVVEWAGDSVGPGGDFLDEGIRQGWLRDFNENGTAKMYYDRQGRRHFEAPYTLYLN